MSATEYGQTDNGTRWSLTDTSDDGRGDMALAVWDGRGFVGYMDATAATAPEVQAWVRKVRQARDESGLRIYRQS